LPPRFVIDATALKRQRGRALSQHQTGNPLNALASGSAGKIIAVRYANAEQVKAYR
jgi:hypothetical protein